MSSTRREKLVQLLYCDKCRLTGERLCTKKYDCGDHKADCLICTENSMCSNCVLCRGCSVKYQQCKGCAQRLQGNYLKEVIGALNEIKTSLEDIHGFFVHSAIGDQLDLAATKND